MTWPRGLRWWELVPEALLAAALTAFAALEPNAAFSAFSSTTAIALMGAAGIAWLALRVVLVRYTSWPVLRLAVFALAGLVVLRVVVYPAFDNDTVVEALPADVAAPPTTSTPSAVIGSAPAPTPDAPTRALASAPLRGIDHRASGTATFYTAPSGRLIVGLENIDIQPGPDYDVYVVPGVDKRDITKGVRLDDLRGNQGTQYYEVPATAGVTPGGWTVMVWCQAFDVPIAAATPVQRA